METGWKNRSPRTRFFMWPFSNYWPALPIFYSGMAANGKFYEVQMALLYLLYRFPFHTCLKETESKMAGTQPVLYDNIHLLYHLNLLVIILSQIIKIKIWLSITIILEMENKFLLCIRELSLDLYRAFTTLSAS